jgi:hypothetical protein
LESQKGTEHLEDVGIDGRIMLEWIFEKETGEVMTGFIWVRLISVIGSCEHGNELWSP